MFFFSISSFQNQKSIAFHCKNEAKSRFHAIKHNTRGASGSLAQRFKGAKHNFITYSQWKSWFFNFRPSKSQIYGFHCKNEAKSRFHAIKHNTRCASGSLAQRFKGAKRNFITYLQRKSLFFNFMISSKKLRKLQNAAYGKNAFSNSN